MWGFLLLCAADCDPDDEEHDDGTEVAGLLVGKALGRPDPALRIPVVQPRTDGLGEAAFSNRDLWSYDSLFDVAANGHAATHRR